MEKEKKIKKPNRMNRALYGLTSCAALSIAVGYYYKISPKIADAAVNFNLARSSNESGLDGLVYALTTGVLIAGASLPPLFPGIISYFTGKEALKK